MGKKAAMACTVAVEEVIGQHYDEQAKELSQRKIKPFIFFIPISLLKSNIRFSSQQLFLICITS